MRNIASPSITSILHILSVNYTYLYLDYQKNMCNSCICMYGYVIDLPEQRPFCLYNVTTAPFLSNIDCVCLDVLVSGVWYMIPGYFGVLISCRKKALHWWGILRDTHAVLLVPGSFNTSRNTPLAFLRFCVLKYPAVLTYYKVKWLPVCFASAFHWNTPLCFASIH